MRKAPLRYQSTEYDCGPVAIMNAISCVCDFSDIPVSVLKMVYNATLDKCNQTGYVGWEGTTLESMEFVANWLNHFYSKVGFPELTCKVLKGDEVSFKKDSELLQWLKQENVVVLIYCKLYNKHYVVLTDADDEFVYLWDSYYWDIDYNDERIVRINDEPFRANRKLSIDFLDTNNEGIYYNVNCYKDHFAILFTGKK